MDGKMGVTQKLNEIVKNRKTPLIINKQENSYKIIRKSRSLSIESFSYNFDE